ncbi:delayed-rectifier potassium channel regulatory subunit KCNS2 isoform X2 [Nothobranchius furzeri]|uniref:delayed-rectifier potassium channel regulatory subunit KCNS2 isoform X2 n=1 Tax=Nothobranchius furzeri TaxID=105023 RepID=UPI0024041F56|nr:potassium voltage-gated channel subfamily S member 2 isoform X2 [Nothobranchius furzeri]XP_054588300.1 potassium voltage-gated channel subfamily S member 2 isoform X2 [Nothobranchius furzeri]
MVKESLPNWVHQDSDEGLVHVNVGGLKRSLCSSTLKKFPDTRLGKLLACDSEEDILQQKEFYFDRNPGLFPYVLHFYQTGKLHVMEELCVFSFSQEIEYWGINEFFLDTCCSYRYHDRKLESSKHRSWDDESDVSSIDTSVDEISDLNKDMQHFQEVRYGNIKKCLWLTLENPGYSIPSKLFSLLSIGVVITSITTMCINSIPEYQTFDSDGKLIEDPTTQTLEVFCSCWFTFEVVTRLLLTPNRKKFFRHPLNIIDMVSVVPIYITLVFDLFVGSESELGDLGRLIQVFRLMRIFRVLKLARHSTGLRSLGATLRHSYREVGILLLYLGVGVSVFSGIAYTAECEEDVGLDTIPACWWWGTVSMTTVGYGDVVPVTVAGKLAASGCILGGTLVVALPITIIFNKFSHFYRRQKALEASVRNNNQKNVRMSEPEEDEESDGDSCCLDDDDIDDIEKDDIDYEDEGGVINYSYVEHPTCSSVIRKKEFYQL